MLQTRVQHVVSLIAILVCVSFSTDANRYYSKLDRLYVQNRSKCIDKSTKLVHKKTEHPAPYFFLALYNQELADQNTDLNKTARYLARSAGYLAKLSKHVPPSTMLLLRIDTLKSRLIESITHCIPKCYMSDLESRADLLNRRLRQLGASPIEKLDQPIDASYENTSWPRDAEVNATEVSNQRYFGLPKGNERCSSFSVEAEKEMFALINMARIEKGLMPYILKHGLIYAARYHAYDMASQNYFNHTSYDRKRGELVEAGGTFERIHKFYNESFVNGENIAAGNEDAPSTYHQWYTSNGHHDIMFNPGSRCIGIAVYFVQNSSYKYYWVMCTAT
ncbi:MAG: hypothetical protein ACI83I_000542 [Bacteroidia bacterium]|jgi:uncharacterized protein YkwD